MDRVFSVEDISDQFWLPPLPPPPFTAASDPKMNRSASEWAFERFLQEANSPLSDTSSSKSLAENDAVEIKEHQNKNNDCKNNNNNNCSSQSLATASFNSGPNIPIDSDDYQAFLKSKLNLACAAVALTRGLTMMHEKLLRSPFGYLETFQYPDTQIHL